MINDFGKIAYVVADLKRVGPTNQTLNIIRFSGAIKNCIVFTLFDEGEDTLINEYFNHGIKVICLHLSRKTALFTGVTVLSQKLKEYKVDFVHSWGTFADIISHYTCKKLGMKHVITLRNFPVEDMTTRMPYILGYFLALFDLHILKETRYVICCSKSIKKKMEESYGWTHLHSIQNGVDFTKFEALNRFLARQSLNVNNDDFIIISTGSIIPRKRIDETIEAFSTATLRKNTTLWLLGEGNLFDELKKKYKENKNIFFLGKKENVVEYLSAADIFVSSSESEGMPNAVLEAISCNLPVILSDIPQHLEVLEEVTNCGMVYELGNKKQLAETFSGLTDERIMEMKRNTANLKNSNFTMENMGKKYEQFYRKI